MKKFLFSVLIMVILTSMLSAITLGVQVKNETVDVGNMEIRAAKVQKVVSNSLASNFIRTGDMIISVCYSSGLGYQAYGSLNVYSEPLLVREPSGNKGSWGNIDREYISINQMVQAANQFGVTGTNNLGDKLSAISQGDPFSIIILRNGRFIEYTIY